MTSTKDQGPALPVSISKIREALETTPILSLRTVDERPTFRIQIREKQKLEELLATLKFKPVPVPAGGLNMAEQNRIMFPSVDNPLRQQFGAFNQSELLTILIENLIGKYLGGKAMNAISKAERASAEAAAKDEVQPAPWRIAARSRRQRRRHRDLRYSCPMRGRSLVTLAWATCAGAAAPRAQEPAPDQSLARMKSVLAKTPLRLTPVEPEATFKIEIHAIHPMHDIFEKPAWQLDPDRPARL